MLVHQTRLPLAAAATPTGPDGVNTFRLKGGVQSILNIDNILSFVFNNVRHNESQCHN